MHCPYCVSEIADEALACPHCARDLYLFKPLLDRIGQLEKVFAEQAKTAAAGAETRIAALETQIANIQAERAEVIPAEVGVQPMLMLAPMVAPAPAYIPTLLLALVPALLLLLLAHGLLLFVYDVKPLYLRIATILIPMPLGLLLVRRHPTRLWLSAGAGFVVALLAVLGMLAITSMIDKVPLLPQDAREWRETFEYVASISLAFLTGMLAGKFYASHHLPKVQPNKIFILFAKVVTPNADGEMGIEIAAKRIDKLMQATTPALAGAASVYAGVKALIGDAG